MTDDQQKLLMTLIGAGAGTLHGLHKERTGQGGRLQTLLRALGYGAAANLATSGMQTALYNSGIKQAESMEKEAIGPLALVSLPFLAYSAYSGAKNTGRAIGDFGRGDVGSGMKNLGRAGVDALFALPMVRPAGMAVKTIGKGLSARGAVTPFSKHMPKFTRGDAGLAKQIAGAPVAAGRYALTAPLELSGRLPGVHSAGQSMIRAGRRVAEHPRAKWWSPNLVSLRGAGIYGGSIGGSLALGVDPRDYGEYPTQQQRSLAHLAYYAGDNALPRSYPGRYRVPYVGGANTMFAAPLLNSGMQLSGAQGGYAGFPVKHIQSSVY